MGIDAKRFGLCLKLSMITSLKYLFVPGVFILVLLYIYLPPAFLIVAYSSPFLVIAAVAIQVCLKYKRLKSQNVKVVEKKKRETGPKKFVSAKDDDVIILRNDGTAISRQMSRRTNFKDRNRLNQEAHGIQKKVSSMPASLKELLGLTPEIEDKPKVLLEVDDKDGSDVKKVIVSESWWKPDEHRHQFDFIGGKVKTGDRNKAVDWTQDDEVERNKRLETLIAKRRARKLEGGKGPVDTDTDNASWPELEIAPILVSRTNRFDRFPRPDTPMPCSAPPVLLPARNPFDLPYDPLEEKPNLRGDSFHEEFTTTQPKDMFLCRHESFRLGSFFKLEHKQDLCGRQPKSKLSTLDLVEEEQASVEETNSVKSQQEEDKEEDSHITQSEVEGVDDSQNVESGLDEQREVEIKTDAADVNHSESSASSSSSSDEDHIFNANIAGVCVSLTSKGRNFPNMINPVKKPLACSIPRKKDASTLSAEDKAKREEYYFYIERKSHHGHSSSLASDMQVEVSEDGSPPPIVNEAFAYDEDGEKEISEDLWGASSRDGGIEIKQSSIEEVHDTETNLLLPSETEIPEKGHPNLRDSDHKLHEIDRDKQLAEDIENSGTSTLSLECVEAEQLIERLRIHPSLGVHSKISVDADELPTDEKMDKENMSSDEDSKGELDTSINHEVGEDISSRIIEDIEGASENLAEKIISEDNPETLTNKEATHHPHKWNDNANSNDIDDKVVCEKEGKGDFVKGMEEESLDLIRQEADIGGPKLLEASSSTNSRNIEDIDGKFIKQSNVEVINSLSTPMEENGSSSFTQDSGNLVRLNEHVDTTYPSKSVEGDSTDMTESDAFADLSSHVIGRNELNIDPTSIGQEPNVHLPQSPITASSIVHNLNEALMSEIMNEEKLESVGHGELESKASIVQEPIPELLTIAEESRSRSIGNIEDESQHSSDSIISVNGEPEGLTMAEEHIPEPSTSFDESNSKSTKDAEGEINQSVRGESEASVTNSTVMDNLENRHFITELPKPIESEAEVSKPEEDDGHIETK